MKSDHLLKPWPTFSNTTNSASEHLAIKSAVFLKEQTSSSLPCSTIHRLPNWESGSRSKPLPEVIACCFSPLFPQKCLGRSTSGQNPSEIPPRKVSGLACANKA